jgi:hypothetical protein
MRTKPVRVTLFGVFPTLIELDASIQEHHQGDVEVTEHPVEEGANITDHARVRAERITITGMFSDTRIESGVAQVSGATGNQPVTTSGSIAKAGESGYADYAYAVLLKLKNERQVLQVQTKLRTYSNMLIESLSVPRDARSGDALMVTIGLKEIRLVKLLRAQITVQTSDPKGRPKTPDGKKTPLDDSSHLTDIVTDVGSALGKQVNIPRADSF